MLEITIIKDTIAGEYIVRHPQGRAGDYFSGGLTAEHKDDATGTALAIGAECGAEPNDITIKRKVRR